MNELRIGAVLPELLAQNPAVKKFFGTVSPDLEILNNIAPSLANLLRQTRAAVKEIGANPDLRHDVISQRQKEIGSKGIVKLDAIRLQSETSFLRVDSALEKAQVYQLESTADTPTEILTELRVQAAWSRILRQLESTADTAGAIKFVCEGIVDRRDLDSFRAVDRELEAYLQSKNQDRLFALAGQYLAPMFGEVAQSAGLLTAVVANGKSLLSSSLHAVRSELSGKTPATRLFGFLRGETFSPESEKFDVRIA